MKNTSYLKIFLLILLFSNSIYAQSNYITLNTLLGDKSNRLLNSNNFGKNIQRQNLDLSISKNSVYQKIKIIRLSYIQV